MSDRPLSPHLQIYKVQVTSFFSIMHRLTGILLFLLLMILSWY
ncbi:succinate dehydrogenase, cytochrome b556 subunit, partial [Wolbachia endosymbiont of Drosophila malagassya]|nr:succinate dehydrogenase, cytochrome b556 subunit [Wolbachia endosymbiont of Drosophila malagassya]